MDALARSPWAVLAGIPDIELVWTTDATVLLGHRARWIPAASTIVIDSRLKRRLARCSLAHELAHVILEHPTPCGSEFFDHRVELEADAFAARLLLPDLNEIATELATACHHGHAATNLRVTLDMLQARLSGLTCDERREIQRRVWSVHEGGGL